MSLTGDIGLALWFGILTSISPCPLATNITSISYIGRKVSSPRAILFSGLLYLVGRSTAYILVGFIAVKGLLAIPGLSFFLQKNMNLALAPLLILIGVMMLDVLPFSFNLVPKSEKMKALADKLGLAGAFFLGFIFALAFCPVSAGLFFGALIPLALKNSSPFLMPLTYGTGTALPVLAFALVLAFGANAVGKIFKAVSSFERWARRVTALVFILIGIFLALKHFLIL